MGNFFIPVKREGRGGRSGCLLRPVSQIPNTTGMAVYIYFFFFSSFSSASSHDLTSQVPTSRCEYAGGREPPPRSGSNNMLIRRSSAHPVRGGTASRLAISIVDLDRGRNRGESWLCQRDRLNCRERSGVWGKVILTCLGAGKMQRRDAYTVLAEDGMWFNTPSLTAGLQGSRRQTAAQRP